MAETDHSKVFDNADFGYYKVTVERPLRLAAQFTQERINSLQFVPALRDIMAWIYAQFGDTVYDSLEQHKTAIEAYIEQEELALNPKNRKAVLNPQTWLVQRDLLATAQDLMQQLGDTLYLDFNEFQAAVDKALKTLNTKLSASEKKQIINAVSWRDESAEKVIKKVHKLKDDALTDKCASLATDSEHLSEYGLFPHPDKPHHYIEYEADSELRDTESIALKEDIQSYFRREVLPHVDDAWIDRSKTQVGYEISFNKYFYQHKPLRSLEEVTAEILALEQETEGLLKRLVTFDF
jgi:type I restriction enzyme M protein